MANTNKNPSKWAEALKNLISKIPSSAQNILADKIDQALWNTNQKLEYWEKDANWNLQPIFQKDDNKLQQMLGLLKVSPQAAEEATDFLTPSQKKQKAINYKLSWMDKNPTPKKSEALKILWWLNQTWENARDEQVMKAWEPKRGGSKNDKDYEWKKDFVDIQKQEMKELKKWEDTKKSGLNSFMRWVNDSMNFITRTLWTFWKVFDPNDKTGYSSLMDTANWLTDFDEWTDDAYALWRVFALIWQIIAGAWLAKWSQVDPSLVQSASVLLPWALNNASFNDVAYSKDFTPEKKAQIDAEIEAWLNALIEKLQNYFNKRNDRYEQNSEEDLYI